jgi:hypothetical protein
MTATIIQFPGRTPADQCRACGRSPDEFPSGEQKPCPSCGQWDGNVTQDPWHCDACGHCLELEQADTRYAMSAYVHDHNGSGYCNGQGGIEAEPTGDPDGYGTGHQCRNCSKRIDLWI